MDRGSGPGGRKAHRVPVGSVGHGRTPNGAVAGSGVGQRTAGRRGASNAGRRCADDPGPPGHSRPYDFLAPTPVRQPIALAGRLPAARRSRFVGPFGAARGQVLRAVRHAPRPARRRDDRAIPRVPDVRSGRLPELLEHRRGRLPEVRAVHAAGRRGADRPTARGDGLRGRGPGGRRDQPDGRAPEGRARPAAPRHGRHGRRRSQRHACARDARYEGEGRATAQDAGRPRRGRGTGEGQGGQDDRAVAAMPPTTPPAAMARRRVGSVAPATPRPPGDPARLRAARPLDPCHAARGDAAPRPPSPRPRAPRARRSAQAPGPADAEALGAGRRGGRRSASRGPMAGSVGRLAGPARPADAGDAATPARIDSVRRRPRRPRPAAPRAATASAASRSTGQSRRVASLVGFLVVAVALFGVAGISLAALGRLPVGASSGRDHRPRAPTRRRRQRRPTSSARSPRHRHARCGRQGPAPGERPERRRRRDGGGGAGGGGSGATPRPDETVSTGGAGFGATPKPTAAPTADADRRHRRPTPTHADADAGADARRRPRNRHPTPDADADARIRPDRRTDPDTVLTGSAGYDRADDRSPTTLEIVPLTPERFADLAALFEQGGDPRWCWCTYFRVRGRDWTNSTAAENRAESWRAGPATSRPRRASSPTRAARVVGWVSVGPREDYERLDATRRSSRRSTTRRSGRSCASSSAGAPAAGASRGAARRRASTMPGDHGATHARGLPGRHRAGRGSRPRTSTTGTLPMFERAGFEVVARRQANAATPVRPDRPTRALSAAYVIRRSPATSSVRVDTRRRREA